MIKSSRDPEQVAVIREEMGREHWRSQLSAQDYDDLLRDADAQETRLREGAYADARAKVSALEDATDDLVTVPFELLILAQNAVSVAEDANAEARLARVSRNQKLLERHRSEGPERLRERASDLRESAMRPINDDIMNAVREATRHSGGKVSLAYLLGTLNMESGGELGKKTPNFGVASQTSSAMGLFQFTADTWIGLANTYGDALVAGAADMDRAALLALRSDPKIAAQAAALLAVENRTVMEHRLGRRVSDFELYLGHFFGGARAAKFLKGLVTAADTPAAAAFSKEAAANRSIFYASDGRARSRREIYDALAERFSRSAWNLQVGDADYLDQLTGKTEERLKKNMMGYIRETGMAGVPPLTDPGGFEKRIETASRISDLWGIPSDEIDPLEPLEVQHYQRVLSEDNPDAKLEAMVELAELGPRLAQRAYRQLGVEGAVYAHGAGLISAGGERSVAYDIVWGRTWLDANPDIVRSIGLSRQTVVDLFGPEIQRLVGAAASDPGGAGTWQTVMESAIAHYAQTHARRGGGWDRAAFERSLDRVLGGTEASPAIAEINGELTVLPPGVSEEAVETWLETATEQAWISINPEARMPRYLRGDVTTVSQLRNNATFEAVGGGLYRVKIGGEYLTTGAVSPRGVQYYTVVIKPEMPGTPFGR